MTTDTAAARSIFAVPFQGQDEDLPVCHAAALYLARNVPTPTFEKLSALLFLADCAHLARYGALMFGGAYEAMRDGPTPTAFLHLARSSQLDLSASPDVSELSDGVMDVLGEVMHLHGEETAEEVSAKTRVEAWQSVPPGQAMTAAHIAHTLPNAAAVLEHLADPHP
ncbi:type II toxin-antitoxin system antitoxin SocA domain-containing protein [Deinococcus frigens]|uniref:type II toxin-antitoxin system antitoxin SocA domain-containing protein n=1 Tax=Deinococcus frigens TaxID=249403 RepID=UPI000497D790|nr:hypothetical protein [Deinococcus frigens]